MKIYEIDKALREALEAMEVNPETGEILNADLLHAVEAEAATKIEATALVVRELSSEADAVAAECKRLQARKDSLQRRADFLRKLLLEAVRATGKVKTARVTVSVRKTTEVVVKDKAQLPEAFTTKTIKVKANTMAIKQALQDGVAVPFCSLEERESVIIR